MYSQCTVVDLTQPVARPDDGFVIFHDMCQHWRWLVVTTGWIKTVQHPVLTLQDYFIISFQPVENPKQNKPHFISVMQLINPAAIAMRCCQVG